MNIIELIFENWYFLLVAFFVISSFFNKAKNAAGGENKQGPKSAPQQRPSTPGKQRPTMPPFGGEGGWPGLPDILSGKLSPPVKPSGDQRKSDPSLDQQPMEGRIAAATRSAEQSANEHSRSSGTHISPDAGRATSLTAKRAEQEAVSHRTSSASRRPRTPFNGEASNNAVQGMMWAEVFGPPRAKRHYRK